MLHFNYQSFKHIAIIVIGVLVILFSINFLRDPKVERVTVISDIWMPYSNGKDMSPRGYMVDIVMDILQHENIQFNYKIADWEQCVKSTNNATADILICVSEFEIYKSENIIRTNNAMGVCNGGVVNRYGDWTYTQLPDLYHHRLGYIDGYFYSQTINAYIDSNPKMVRKYYTAEAGTALFEALLNDKIDAFIEDHWVYAYETSRNKTYKEQTKISKPLENKQRVYIGFPNTTRGRYLKRLIDDNFEEMRINGSIDRILQTYNLTNKIFEMPK